MSGLSSWRRSRNRALSLSVLLHDRAKGHRHRWYGAVVI